MIDKKALVKIRKDLHAFDEKREIVIKTSRDILRSSKQAINAVHRQNLKDASSLLKQAEKDIKKIEAMFKKDIKLATLGAYRASMEEYAEAKCFFHYVKNGKLLSPTKLKVSGEIYLMGLCDLTGELGRRSVKLATHGKYKELEKLRNLVDDIHAFFASLNLRNSELRKKYDSIKWNLKKIEEVLYDVNIRKK